MFYLYFGIGIYLLCRREINILICSARGVDALSARKQLFCLVPGFWEYCLIFENCLVLIIYFMQEMSTARVPDSNCPLNLFAVAFILFCQEFSF